MAARRVARSAVDWTSLATKVPEGQKESFRVLKSLTDKYVTQVAELPEALPKIDFEEFRRRIRDKTLVAEFEKMYAAVEVPYPKDPSNNMAKIQSEEAAAIKKRDAYLQELGKSQKELKDILETITTIPGPEKMTMQMYNHYFPNSARNPNRDNPGFYPHNLEEMQLDKDELRTYRYNTYWNRGGFRTTAEWEILSEIAENQKEAERAKLQAEKKSKSE